MHICHDLAEAALGRLVENFIVSGHRGRADALTVLSRRYLDASPNVNALSATCYDIADIVIVAGNIVRRASNAVLSGKFPNNGSDLARGDVISWIWADGIRR